MKLKAGTGMLLGIFVTAGIALFIFGIYRIGSRQQLFSRSFSISCAFADVNGLQPGNNVRFAGIAVGTVELIRLESDSTVRVHLLIQEGVRPFIKKDAVAGISSEGLMGNKILVIYPGTRNEEPVQHSDSIASVTPVSLEDVMQRFKTSVDNVAYISEGLLGIVDNVRKGKGAIGKLFSDTALARELDESIKNIREGSSEFKNSVEAARKSWLLRGLLKDKKEKEENKSDREERRKREKKK